MTIYFILAFFHRKKNPLVTSDYNELDVSVPHVPRMIFYLSVLCVMWLHIARLVGLKKGAQRNQCHRLHTELIAPKLDVFTFGGNMQRWTQQSKHTESGSEM